MEKLKGWKINLEEVYGRNFAEKEDPWIDLYESPEGQVACLLYDIKEIGVSKEVGSLAVFYNKEKPEMIFNFHCLECFYLYDSMAQFGKDGIVFVHRFGSGNLKLCILNLTGRQFAVPGQLSHYFYQARHIEGTKYSFKNRSSEETTIELNQLKWRPLHDWCDFYPDAPITHRVLRLAFILIARPLYVIRAGFRAWIHFIFRNHKNETD